MSNNQPPKKKDFFRTFTFILVIVTAILVYAYGFQATQFNLEETSEPQRQKMLVNIIRELARPYIIDYKKEEINVHAGIYVPCPASGGVIEQVEASATDAYVIITPSCNDVDKYVQIEGFNFYPKKQVEFSFIPPSNVLINLGTIYSDAEGHFVKEVQLPERPSSEEQTIEIKTVRNVGMPFFTTTAKETGDKILETVFLALLATTFGLIVSVPLSFLAARNLMRDIKNPMISIIFYMILIPIGFWLTVTVIGEIGKLNTIISRIPFLDLIVSIALLFISYFLFRWSISKEENTIQRNIDKFARGNIMGVIFFTTIMAGFLLSSLLVNLGDLLHPILGPLSFLAKFMKDIGSIIKIVIFIVGGFAGAAFAMSVGGKLGQIVSRQMSNFTSKLLLYISSPIAFAFVAMIFGFFIAWLYRIQNLWQTFYLPIIIGAAIGLIVAIFVNPKKPVAFGMTIYYICRTIFNSLRSIEPLVMGIVFVVWVGIGPFAGVLALSLHTVASLSKLFSEQVENIQNGPLEAVRATGANRLQIIAYAVIPQIIPPYISLTMDRWDINVRMSTIIGFVGGGGVGFLLQQNINMLRYRAASVQMIAIAIVVATMDYISSRLRQKAI